VTRKYEIESPEFVKEVIKWYNLANKHDKIENLIVSNYLLRNLNERTFNEHISPEAILKNCCRDILGSDDLAKVTGFTSLGLNSSWENFAKTEGTTDVFASQFQMSNIIAFIQYIAESRIKLNTDVFNML
jgi:hypothetical protein